MLSSFNGILGILMPWRDRFVCQFLCVLVHVDYVPFLHPRSLNCRVKFLLLGLLQDIRWYIQLSSSLYLNFNYLVSVTAGGPVSPRGHMLSSSSVDFGWFVAFGEHQNFPCLKLIEIVIWGFIPVGFSLFLHFLVIIFTFLIYMFGPGSLMSVHYPKCKYGPYC